MPQKGLTPEEEALVLKWASEADISYNLALNTLEVNGKGAPKLQEVIDYQAKLKFLVGFAMLREYQRLSVKETA